MSLYAFKTENHNAVIEWVSATKQRAKDTSLIKNPLNWRIKTIRREDFLYVIVEAKPVYFNFSWFGWVTAGGLLVILGLSAWIIPFLVIGCLGIFWTAEPVFLLTKKALRKHGYSGSIKRLKLGDMIREVVL